MILVKVQIGLRAFGKTRDAQTALTPNHLHHSHSSLYVFIYLLVSCVTSQCLDFVASVFCAFLASRRMSSLSSFFRSWFIGLCISVCGCFLISFDHFLDLCISFLKYICPSFVLSICLYVVSLLYLSLCMYFFISACMYLLVSFFPSLVPSFFLSLNLYFFQILNVAYTEIGNPLFPPCIHKDNSFALLIGKPPFPPCFQ